MTTQYNSLSFHLAPSVLAIALLAASPPARAQTPAPTSAVATPPPKKTWLDTIKLSGFIQGQLVANEASGDGLDAAGAPTNRDRFEVRRARLKLTYADGPAEAVLHIDALPSGFRLLEAEASGKIAWHGDAYTTLTAGLFRNPFGWELQESMSKHPFPERSLWANRLFPGVRDVGARIWGAAWAERLVYQLAVVNGQPIGDSTFPGSDPNAEKDFVGRLGTQLELPSGKLRLGASALVGTGYLAPVEEDDTTPETEAHGPVDFPRHAVGADLVLTFDLPVIGELGLYAELVLARNLDRARASTLPPLVLDEDGVPTDEVDDADALGFYVGVLQHLGEHCALGARYDRFDPDTDGDDDALSYVTFVAHAYPAPPIRVTAAYELRSETPKVDDNQFWLRMQVIY